MWLIPKVTGEFYSELLMSFYDSTIKILQLEESALQKGLGAQITGMQYQIYTE